MSRRSRQREGSRARRRFPRWQVPDGRLVGPILTARVLDLGPAGARIETTSALRVGAPYAFTLKLADLSRRLHGRVCWCRLVATREAADGERTAVYRAGIVWVPRED
jgi:hypothetical protein